MKSLIQNLVNIKHDLKTGYNKCKTTRINKRKTQNVTSIALNYLPICEIHVLNMAGLENNALISIDKLL